MADERITGILLPIWNKQEPWFRFNQKFKHRMVAKTKPWRLEPDDRKTPVHNLASTRDSLIAVTPEAIVIGSPVGKSNVSTGKTSLLLVPGPLMLLGAFVYALFIGGEFYIVSVIPLVGFVLTGIIQTWFLKSWLCAPKDWPTIFNRKDRTVTYAPVRRPRFWKFWDLKVPMDFRTESWADLRVRSYKYVEGTTGGASFHDSYQLMLLWGGLDGRERELKDVISIGYIGYIEDEMLWMLWEHIRQYMEEGGPAIRRGEKLRHRESGKPIVYPSAVLRAAGGAPLSEKEVEQLAAAAPAS
ncbi:MAG: hypothetical protein ABI114_07855 [Rhodanobacter sp.]